MKNAPPPPVPVAIIGGGPAGLMAAEKLALAGASVTVYDRMPTVGRKFLMAGRGGLNLTHSEPLPAFIARYGAAAAWLTPVIKAFPPQNLRQWCESLGIETFVGSSGRVFPVGMKASPLLRAWLKRLEKLGVTFALRHSWKGWDAQGRAVVADAQGRETTLDARAVILALGGASWPRLGSDGGWVQILEGQGIAVTPLCPANCGFIAPWSASFGTRFAGTPLKPVAIDFAGRRIQGEAMLTREGIEGGLLYAFSAPLREAIAATGEAVPLFDLRPGIDADTLTKRLRAPRGSQSTSTFLRKAAGLTPETLGLLREALGEKPWPTDAAELARFIKAAPIRLTATTPLARAISSAGGIRRDELDAQFMLIKKPGVFAIGEMLDWEAPTGGYLLQASFSMAVAAAQGVAAYLHLSDAAHNN